MDDKKKEFDNKIGSSESDFCSVCNKTTSHRWIRETIVYGPSSKPDWVYFLRCKACGTKVEIHRIIG